MDTKQMLNRLYEAKAARVIIDQEKQALIDSVITPEIKAKFAEIDAEFSDKYRAVDDTYSAIEGEVKAAVLELGETAKGDYLMAVFAKGRVSWDTKALDGYAAGHPEIAQFRKEGAPSVSIRAL